MFIPNTKPPCPHGSTSPPHTTATPRPIRQTSLLSTRPVCFPPKGLRGSQSLTAVTGFASEKGRKTGILLQIPSARVLCTDPSAVKTMLPKLTTRGRSGMRFAAIKTRITMRASLAVIGGGNRGIRLRIALTLRAVRAVMFLTVWTTTDGADNVGENTRRLRVTPSTTVRAKGNADMESGSANDTRRALNKERAPIEGLGSGPGLRIPDIEVNGA